MPSSISSVTSLCMYYLMHMVMMSMAKTEDQVYVLPDTYGHHISSSVTRLAIYLPDADGHDEHGEDRGPGLVPFLHRKNYA